jgi:hypothetical protein
LVTDFDPFIVLFQFVETGSHVHEDGKLKIMLNLGIFIRVFVLDIEADQAFKVSLEGLSGGVSLEELVAFETAGVDPFELLFPGEGGDKLKDGLLFVELRSLVFEFGNLPES